MSRWISCKTMRSTLRRIANKSDIRLFMGVISVVLLIALQGCGTSAPEEVDVVLGDERKDEYLPLLKGRRVALYSNMSGIVGDRIMSQEGSFVPRPESVTEETALDKLLTQEEASQKGLRYGPHILDILLTEGIEVTAIFSPEHGFRGIADAGELVPGSIDTATGVPIVSLYENGDDAPDESSMNLFDVLVVDIQDVGLRYYTYYITMHHLMEACAHHGKKVVILDRPNPNGFYVDGPILDTARLRSGVGWLGIPVVHGMTLGELALMTVGEGWMQEAGNLDLEVVPCLGYTHEIRYSLLMPPSPNLKDMKSVYLYSSTCFFEGTIVTAGRGTPWPFEIYGHPSLEGPFSFVPRSIPGARKPRYMDIECRGRDLRSKSLDDIWAAGINLEYVVDAFSAMHCGQDFFLPGNHFDHLSGVTWVREMILSGASASEIKSRWRDDVRSFAERRRPYLLYPE